MRFLFFHRYKVWLAMSGGQALWDASPHLYSQLLARARSGIGCVSEIAEIEKDLHR